MFTVYIMESVVDGRRYIGSTQNLLRRFRELQAGESNPIRGRGPWKIVYTEFMIIGSQPYGVNVR